MSNVSELSSTPSIMLLLPYLHGQPVGTIELRQEPGDFIVEEQLCFSPSGHGPHLFLQIKKIGQNTEWVAKQLARWAGVPAVQVGYAGQKDRHATTTQWFSVYWPAEHPLGPEPDLSTLVIEGIEILNCLRHDKKLKIGALSSNRFKITGRHFVGDREGLEARFAKIVEQGVPNYYGEQRFGREGNNLVAALAWFEGAKAPKDMFYKHLYRSVLKSYYFNRVLAQRIEEGCWQVFQDGDVLAKEGSSSFFYVDAWSDLEQQRLSRGEIHITGPLLGKLRASDRWSPYEEACLKDLDRSRVEDFLRGDFHRRALRVLVHEPSLSVIGDDIVIEFTLSKGAYATCVLRELVQWESYANFSE